jgi:branched-chain amino acid transport system permease protein
MIVIGGLATVSGAVTGAAIITVVYEILRGVEEKGSLLGISVPQVSGLAQMALAVITLLILIFRPEGILGYRELEDWGQRGFRRFRTRRRQEPVATEGSPGHAAAADGEALKAEVGGEQK